jgi:hypothetical protein
MPREASLGVGLGTAAIVWAIYSGHLPGVAETRVNPPGDDILAGTERTASWIAAGFVGGIAWIAKDPTVLVIGGVTLLALSWAHKHANQHDPMSSATAVSPSSRQVAVESPYSPSS